MQCCHEVCMAGIQTRILSQARLQKETSLGMIWLLPLTTGKHARQSRIVESMRLMPGGEQQPLYEQPEE